MIHQPLLYRSPKASSNDCATGLGEGRSKSRHNVRERTVVWTASTLQRALQPAGQRFIAGPPPIRLYYVTELTITEGEGRGAL